MKATVDSTDDRSASEDKGTAATSTRQLFSDHGRENNSQPEFMASSMPALRALTTSREHCDVVLRTTDCAELWEHRFVLATRYTGCGAFLSCSKEKTSFLFEWTPEHEDIAWSPLSKAVVSDLSSKMFELLVDLAYQVPIQESAGLHNAREVLDLAGALDIATVRDHCLQLLGGNSEPEDCVCSYQLSLGNGYGMVSSKAFRYIVRNFDKVLAVNSEFPSLMPDELISVLHDDELLVPNEVECAFGAFLKWIQGNIENSRGHFPRLLPLIRLAHCSHADLGKVESDHLVRASNPALEVLFVVTRTLSQEPLSDVYWKARPDLSERRWLKQKVPKDVLFMVGGWTGGASNHLLLYSGRSSRWLLQPLQNAHRRAYLGVAMLSGLIYFVGGFDDHECYHAVVILDVSRLKWTSSSDMQMTRWYVGEAVFQGYIYAVGGFDGEDRTSSCGQYDDKSNQLNFVASMHALRSYACAAAEA